MRHLAITVFASLVLISCSLPPELLVTSEEAGEEWPYPKASKAIIKCQKHNQVLIEINGKEYGLNGKAQGAGYPPSQQQMAADADGVIMNTGPSDWVKRGLKLC